MGEPQKSGNDAGYRNARVLPENPFAAIEKRKLRSAALGGRNHFQMRADFFRVTVQLISARHIAGLIGVSLKPFGQPILYGVDRRRPILHVQCA